jgi:hypothetical protein
VKLLQILQRTNHSGSTYKHWHKTLHWKCCFNNTILYWCFQNNNENRWKSWIYPWLYLWPDKGNEIKCLRVGIFHERHRSNGRICAATEIFWIKIQILMMLKIQIASMTILTAQNDKFFFDPAEHVVTSTDTVTILLHELLLACNWVWTKAF